MGRKKFYRTSVGRVRAELLLLSGEQFATESVEFRLCREHYQRKLSYELNAVELVLSRIGNLLLHIMLPRLEQVNAREVLASLRESEDRLAALMDPVRFEMVRKKDEKAYNNTVENKVAYLEELNVNGCFTSIDDIIKAVQTLNSRIENARK